MKTILQYPTVIQSISIIRDDLKDYAETANIPDSELRQITLVIEELFSKIVKFAFEDDENHLLELALERMEKEILIEMKDDGDAFNPLEYNAKQENNPAYIEDGGMDLSLIRAFCDSIRYLRENSQNIVLIRKSIRGQSESE